MTDTLAGVRHDPPLLSIVIPVGPGDRAYQGLLQCLNRFPAPCQIILSACEPLSPAWPDPPGIELLQVTGRPGRAGQLNRGIESATANCLWLLHADSRPGQCNMHAAARFARECTADTGSIKLGWFDLEFAPDGPALTRLNALGASLRSRMLKLPFGDQAWLMSRTVFARTGGFDETFGRGEDLDFIVRTRRTGTRLCRLQPAIRTSARRYRERGWLRTTLAHLWLTLRLWLKSIQRRRNQQP